MKKKKLYNLNFLFNKECKTCFEKDNISCLSCNSPRFLYEWNCLVNCPDGYFGNSNLQKC